MRQGYFSNSRRSLRIGKTALREATVLEIMLKDAAENETPSLEDLEVKE